MDLKGRGRALIEVISRNFSGGIEEKYKGPQSEQRTSHPSVTTEPTCSVYVYEEDEPEL
jgi:hypothetical protein